MSKYRIRMDIPIDADSPEEAAEKFRQWLRMHDRDNLFSPKVDVSKVRQTGRNGRSVPMDVAVFEWWEQEQRSPLKPQVEYFKEDPTGPTFWSDVCPPSSEDEGGCGEPDDDEEPMDFRGWFVRMCAIEDTESTEWDGPHDTQYLAMEALFNLYGE